MSTHCILLNRDLRFNIRKKYFHTIKARAHAVVVSLDLLPHQKEVKKRLRLHQIERAYVFCKKTQSSYYLERKKNLDYKQTININKHLMNPVIYIDKKIKSSPPAKTLKLL